MTFFCDDWNKRAKTHYIPKYTLLYIICRLPYYIHRQTLQPTYIYIYIYVVKCMYIQRHTVPHYPVLRGGSYWYPALSIQKTQAWPHAHVWSHSHETILMFRSLCSGAFKNKEGGEWVNVFRWDGRSLRLLATVWTYTYSLSSHKRFKKEPNYYSLKKTQITLL